MVVDLLLAITQHNLIEGVEDEWLWSSDFFFSFSISSFFFFFVQVFKESISASMEWIQGHKAWKGLAPPQAELLIWFIFQGRLNAKERLRRLNYLNSNDSRCMFCANAVESFEHRFFTCPVSWQVWHNYLQQWNLSCCLSCNPVMFFDEWLSAPFRNFDKKI